MTARQTQENVTWDAEQLAAIDTSKAGSYEVAGTLADGTAVTAQVEVEMVNYVLNPSFEDEDTSMWKVSYEERIIRPISRTRRMMPTPEISRSISGREIPI